MRDLDAACSVGPPPIPRSQARHGRKPADPSASVGGLAPWQIARIVDYVESNLSITISVASMAAHVQLSTSHFSRAFQISFNDSPYNYVLRQRLNYSRTLMLRTDYSLSQVALEIGMADQAHFTNTFKRFFGVTPRAWREQSGH